MLEKVNRKSKFKRTSFRVLFLVYALLSRQWRYECWPLNTQLSLFFSTTLFFNGANGVKSQLLYG